MTEVKVIAVTKPLIEGVETAEELVAYAARVSNPSNQMNTETSSKLLKYCIDHKHWSIFEMVNVVMSIDTTRDIARQILRHRSFSFQEFSQRYADPTQGLGFEVKEARLQDTKNRQNSIELSEEHPLHGGWDLLQNGVIEKSLYAYNWAIDNGIAKEQARAVLPEGLTASRLYMNGSLRSWIHYCMIRCDKATQKEHREVATQAWKNIVATFPSLDGLIELEPKPIEKAWWQRFVARFRRKK
jgi:thymidylate synthase (FAD)